MARALLGYVGNSNEPILAIEINRLRNRVRELEAELADLRNGGPAAHAEIDLELHRMTEQEGPVLA